VTLDVQRSVVVTGSAEAVFDLFTEGIDDWWPLGAGFAYGGERARSIHLEPWVGGRFFERLADGDELQVGSVLECNRPRTCTFTWQAPVWSVATRVRVEFTSVGDGTRVDLTHDGFELLGADGAAEARRFGGGWPAVLDRLASAVSAGSSGD
jgi:uncharacterized protein YndB with AHSA1/START domain